MTGVSGMSEAEAREKVTGPGGPFEVVPKNVLRGEAENQFTDSL